MAAQVSVDVRTLFTNLGIEFEKAGTDLVIDRFEQWGIEASAGTVRGCNTTCFCRADVLEAA
ncbi:hypothetical protein [Amycolatopsis australiensis]|uniref:Uncharacterized protein n=1 Tax=Amycolatopsis australiensis TaxID=546364 RepID=A0A1K1RIZ8_9PSEU|nr:hypothetical protein [Amycolatopsis australiensis]SFW72218.1 hypothetical protein SAMN04489730_3406 [Amycolatopsis australiensis]